MGYRPWGHKKSDMTERLHFTSLSLSRFICLHMNSSISPSMQQMFTERLLWATQGSGYLASIYSSKQGRHESLPSRNQLSGEEG